MDISGSLPLLYQPFGQFVLHACSHHLLHLLRRTGRPGEGQGVLHHGQPVGQQVCQRGAQGLTQRPLPHRHLFHHRFSGASI